MKSNKATVGECASTCADSSTMFVYGTNNKQCYCINGATSRGECSDPFSNYALDLYRYNSKSPVNLIDRLKDVTKKAN